MYATNMFVLLVLAAPVVGEWVEIAQHRHDPSRKATFSNDRSAGANYMYANNSLADHSWHSSDLVGNIHFGTVKRVSLQGKNKELFSAGVLPERTPSKAIPNEKLNIKESVETIFSIDVPEKTNKSDIKSHNLSRYSVAGAKVIRPKVPNASVENVQLFKNNNFQEIIRIYEESNSAPRREKPLERNANIQRVPSASIVGISKSVQSGKETRGNVNQHVEQSETGVKTSSILNKTLFEDHNSPLQNPYLPEPTLQHQDKYDADKTDKQVRRDNAKEVHDSQHKRKDTSNVHYAGENASVSMNTRANTMEVIFALMKVVTDNISRNTLRSFSGKIKYLEGIRKNIIANIAERIEQAWPDDAHERRRGRRGARGHVEFPSSESALMTISFLTFAVFLIKLVLQVIHTYKNKTMMVTPAVVAAVGRAAASIWERTRP